MAASDDSIGATFSRFADDAKAFVKAEFDYRKAQAAVEADHYRVVVILGVVALAAFHLALIALTVGLVVSFAEVLGGWAATAIVTVLYLVIAGISAGLARAYQKRPRA